MSKKESIKIVLYTYKNGHLSEEDAIKLIEDITSCDNTIINNPPIIPYWPTITYEQPTIPQRWEITCKTD